MPLSVVFSLRSKTVPRQDFLLCPGTFQLGRSSSCDVVVGDLSVSRRHARIEVDRRQCRVIDLGSQNGSFVDGVRIEDALVECGQRVRFGDAVFEFRHSQPEDDVADWEESTVVGENKDQIVLHPLCRRLTPAQTRVLLLLVKGMSEKEIGNRLEISPHTVHNHIIAIYRVFEVHSRSEFLVSIFREMT